MKHPPYHLRANKAADRMILIEAINRVARAIGLDYGKYTYYGFGGPFLEDFKIIRKFFPEMKLVSIEKNQDTYKRQHFHKFCKDINLVLLPFDRFLSRNYEPGLHDIFWMDFTDLRPSYLGWISQLVPQLGVGSIFKITFPCLAPLRPQVLSNLSKIAKLEASRGILEEFSKKYSDYITSGFEDELSDPEGFASLIVDMVKSAVGEVRLSSGESVQLISAHRYADHTPMVSCSFVIADSTAAVSLDLEMEKWSHAHGRNSKPYLLDLPLLSVQERLKLDSLLPQKKPTGRSLFRALGYRIDDDDDKSIEMLSKYAEFQRYFPLFGKLEF